MQSNKIKLKKSCFCPKDYVRFILIIVQACFNMSVNILYTPTSWVRINIERNESKSLNYRLERLLSIGSPRTILAPNLRFLVARSNVYCQWCCYLLHGTRFQLIWNNVPTYMEQDSSLSVKTAPTISYMARDMKAVFKSVIDDFQKHVNGKSPCSFSSHTTPRIAHKPICLRWPLPHSTYTTDTSSR